VQGLDYPKTITRLVKKPGGKGGKSTFHIFKSTLTSMIQMVQTWFSIYGTLKMVEKVKRVMLIHQKGVSCIENDSRNVMNSQMPNSLD